MFVEYISLSLSLEDNKTQEKKTPKNEKVNRCSTVNFKPSTFFRR